MKQNPQNIKNKLSEDQKSLLSVIKKPRVVRRGGLNVLSTKLKLEYGIHETFKVQATKKAIPISRDHLECFHNGIILIVNCFQLCIKTK